MVERYATTATPPPGNVDRDTAELSAALARALAERDPGAPPPSADATLSTVARWLLGAQAARRELRHGDAELVARRLGFAGVVSVVLSFPLEGAHARDWQGELAKAPANMVLNRFGVHASPTAGAAVVVLGAVEASMAPFPTRVEVGQSVRLRGEAPGRYHAVNLFVTGVDGSVDKRRFEGRRFDATVAFPRTGLYRVEVMGDGPTGPVVLINVPVRAGNVPDEPMSGRAGTVLPAAVESRLFVLLNEARVKAGLPRLVQDTELRAVALSHTEDMIRARFFGHASPTTGQVDDRLRRAGVDVTVAGENLAQANSAEEIHDGLMDSPGHRANILSPRFTHVGIAALPSEAGALMATQVFGRRPPEPAEVPRLAQVLDSIARLRRAAGIEPLVIDPVLQSAAEAGIRGLGQASPEAALQAATDVLGRRRRGGCGRLFELRELDQLAEIRDFVDPKLGRVGLALGTRREGGVTRIAMVLVADEAGCS